MNVRCGARAAELEVLVTDVNAAEEKERSGERRPELLSVLGNLFVWFVHK